MQATRAQLEVLLDAAERLLNAREVQMLTTEEWDALEHAVAACNEPPANERTETFTVDGTRALVRSVVPMKGEPYPAIGRHSASLLVEFSAAERDELLRLLRKLIATNLQEVDFELD